MSNITISTNHTSKTISCAICGEIVPRTGPIQWYCYKCSKEKNQKRTKPKKETILTTEAQKERAKNREISEKGRIRRGREISKILRSSICWGSSDPVDLHTIIRVSVPFTWSFSKNRIFSIGRGNSHVFLRKDVKSARQNLIDAISYNISKNGNPFKKGKVWLDIFVQKPNNRGDAVNVVDSVCDSVKIAIGIDDRYFSIRKLDWQITKENPRIYVGIGQSNIDEMFCCAYCGRELSLNHRSPQKRTCNSCQYEPEFQKFLQEHAQMKIAEQEHQNDYDIS